MALVSAPLQWRALRGPVVSPHLGSQLRHAGHSCKPSSLNSFHKHQALGGKLNSSDLTQTLDKAKSAWIRTSQIMSRKICKFCHLESVQWQETPSVRAGRNDVARSVVCEGSAAVILLRLQHQLTALQLLQLVAPPLRSKFKIWNRWTRELSWYETGNQRTGFGQDIQSG